MRRSRSRAGTSCRRSSSEHGLQAKEFEIDDEALADDHPPLHAGGRRAQSRARAGDAGAQGVKELILSKKKTIKITAEEPRGVSRRAALSLRRGRARGPGRRRHRAGLDRGRRRAADDRRRHDARQGQDDGDRQSARRDEGIDLGGGVLRPLPRHRFRHQAAALRQEGHPRPRAGGRDAQGRSVGRRRDGRRRSSR